jgi:hypothetical protein
MYSCQFYLGSLLLSKCIEGLDKILFQIFD